MSRSGASPLTNLTGAKLLSIDITGDDAGRVQDMQNLNVTIPASGYLVVGQNMAWTGGSQPVDVEYIDSGFAELRNSGAALQLVDGNGLIIDVLAYGDAPVSFAEGDAPAVFPGSSTNKGHSLARCFADLSNPHLDSGNNANDFAVDQTPSPGGSNTAACATE